LFAVIDLCFNEMETKLKFHYYSFVAWLESSTSINSCRHQCLSHIVCFYLEFYLFKVVSSNNNNHLTCGFIRKTHVHLHSSLFLLFLSMWTWTTQPKFSRWLRSTRTFKFIFLKVSFMSLHELETYWIQINSYIYNFSQIRN
jgi:hypothetical protein